MGENAAMQEVHALPAVDAQFDTWGISRSTKTTASSPIMLAVNSRTWKAPCGDESI